MADAEICCEGEVVSVAVGEEEGEDEVIVEVER